MEQLAARCIAESLRNNEDEFQLGDRLSSAREILWAVWYAGAPEIATRWRMDNEKPSDEEQKIINRAKTRVWRRRDPKRSFQEGFESEHYTNFSLGDFHASVACYLEDPGFGMLRSIGPWSI